ncbi:MAG: hypothetical protein ACI4AM_04835 [Muribaculaceae bacterium]
MSTKQKERLISLFLSLWFELAIRLSEKDGLTLFFANGISPPLVDGKVTNYFLIRRSYLAIYSTNLRKKGDLRRKKVIFCVKKWVGRGKASLKLGVVTKKWVAEQELGAGAKRLRASALLGCRLATAPMAGDKKTGRLGRPVFWVYGWVIS